ncbi:MAG: DUF7527 domain-containing protein [Halococcoides sp.]
MTTRTVDRVDDWEEVPYEGGEDGLQRLADQGFSGLVRTAGGTACFLDGSVVGVLDGTLDTVADAAGTAYRAPSDALPLLAVMQERSDGPRAKYYTEDTPISEVDRRLSEAGFTGYIELSENVLSGDYYIVYHGGRSTSAAFVGASERLITDQEAFETADDEVGIFEVYQVDIDVQEVEAAGDTESSTENGVAGAASTEPGGTSAGRPGADDGPSDPLDARDGTDRERFERDQSDGALDPLDAARDERTADRQPADEASTEPHGDPDAASEREESTEAPDREEYDTTDPLVDPGDSEGRPTHEDDRSPRDRSTRDERRASDDASETRSPADRDRAERDDTPDRRGGDDHTDRSEATQRSADHGSASEDRTAGSERRRSRDTATGDRRREETADQSREDAGNQPRESSTSGRASDDPSDASARTETTGSDASGRTPTDRSREDLSPEDLERRSIPSVDPAKSESPSDESGGTASTTGTMRETPPEPGAPSEQIRDLEAQIDERDRRIEELESTVDRLREERSEYRSRIEELEGQLEELAEERDALAERLDSRPAESATSPTREATRALSPDEALAGTNLFVRYASRGEATLEAAAGGSADRSAVSENLRLEHHTQFDADDVTVDGRPFETFLESSLLYRFVSWLVEDLIYEIRDTGHGRALADLYEALPRIDRAELHGSVSVQVEVDGETSREQRDFDVVVRDRMGNPLIVADLNDDRDAATGSMMETLVRTATDVGASHDRFAAGFLVTQSYFDPEALETAAEATGGGLFSRDSRESYVKLSRKDGFHLCLVEARDEQFHLAVPELKSS